MALLLMLFDEFWRAPVLSFVEFVTFLLPFLEDRRQSVLAGPQIHLRSGCAFLSTAESSLFRDRDSPVSVDALDLVGGGAWRARESLLRRLYALT